MNPQDWDAAWWTGASAGLATKFTIDPSWEYADYFEFAYDGFEGFLADPDVVASGAGQIAHAFEPTISEVPLPAAAWLLGSGLVGLIGVGRARSG